MVVGAGATLGGNGAILGNVQVGSGAALSPGASAGTLTVGALHLAAGSILNYELAAPNVVGNGVNDLVNVLGDLTLAGTLNVTALPGFGIGTYRLIDYGGALTDNGLSFGELPAGFAYALRPATGQVDLSVDDPKPEPVQFWDGSNLAGDGIVNGGSGVWSAGRTSWTNATGAANQAFGGEIAVFGSGPGAVTVQGEAEFRTLRFLTNGYSLVAGAGGALKTGAMDTVVQVDGGVLAAIDVPIGGPGGINLLGQGMLLVTSDNTYTGGTTIGDAAVLQLGACGTRGSILGDVRDDNLLVFSRSDDTRFAGSISGRGGVIELLEHARGQRRQHVYGRDADRRRDARGRRTQSAGRHHEQRGARLRPGHRPALRGHGVRHRFADEDRRGHGAADGQSPVARAGHGAAGRARARRDLRRIRDGRTGRHVRANGAIGGPLTVEGRVSIRTPAAVGSGRS